MDIIVKNNLNQTRTAIRGAYCVRYSISSGLSTHSVNAAVNKLLYTVTNSCKQQIDLLN